MSHLASSSTGSAASIHPAQRPPLSSSPPGDRSRSHASAWLQWVDKLKKLKSVNKDRAAPTSPAPTRQPQNLLPDRTTFLAAFEAAYAQTVSPMVGTSVFKGVKDAAYGEIMPAELYDLYVGSTSPLRPALPS